MFTRRVMVCLFLTIGTVITACGGESEQAAEPRVPMGDPGPIHVHGLGVNPQDGALFIATHTGLFRAAPGEMKSRRVGGRFQDTMGFTVTGPDRFLGSGHPDGRDELPPYLGLIRSDDAGRSWEPVSLLGERDFHVLEATGRYVYGYGSDFATREAGLLVSDDQGRSWKERPVPEPLLSLAIDPENPERIVVAGERSTYVSLDGGSGWRKLGDEGGFVAWPRRGALFLLRLDGAVRFSADGGRTWEERGIIGGEPAAFESHRAELYGARHDGTIRWSEDGGRTWQDRSRP